MSQFIRVLRVRVIITTVKRRRNSSRAENVVRTVRELRAGVCYSRLYFVTARKFERVRKMTLEWMLG
jgi:hypothetical protein